MIDHLQEKFGVDRETATRDTGAFVASLRELGLLASDVQPKGGLGQGEGPGPYRLEGLELASGLVLGHDLWSPPRNHQMGVTQTGARSSTRAEPASPSLCSAVFRGPRFVRRFGPRIPGRPEEGSAVADSGDHGFPRDGRNRRRGVARNRDSAPRAARLAALYLKDEMDLVGPIAGPLLQVYGPTYPSNGHFMHRF